MFTIRLAAPVVEPQPEEFPAVQMTGGPEDLSAGSNLPSGDGGEETLAEAARRIALKYDAMERLAVRIVNGQLPSLIISGPPGMSKSHTLEWALRNSRRIRFEVGMLDGLEDFGATLLDDTTEFYDKISGGCSAPGLYHALWNMRNGGLVLLDDCDSIFDDPDARNLVKLATDSSEERRLSWRKRSSWLMDHGISKDFVFNGHMVFLTNIDFEQVIKRNPKDVEHFKALIDRAHYLCLTLRTQRDFMIRIRAVSEGENGMLRRVYGFTPEQTATALDFIEHHKMRFYNLSLRLVCHVAQTMLADPEYWQADCEATKMKTGS